MDNYAVPLYYADSSTPRVAVANSRSWWAGFGAGQVPMPPEAKADPSSDHHLVIWDVPNNMLWEFWEMVKNPDGSWKAGTGFKLPANGTGYNTLPNTNGARAYGGSLIAGAIRYQEMKNGVINHPLAVSYLYTRGKHYAMGLGKDGVTMNIASHSDNSALVNRQHIENIPEGARLRIKPSVNVDARCEASVDKPACKIIARAFQTYGAYMVDTAGAPTIYAENLQGKSVSWTGVINSVHALRIFTAADYEVLSLPPTLTAMP